MLRERKREEQARVCVTACKDSGLSAPSSPYAGSQGYHLLQEAAETALGPLPGLCQCVR